MDKERLLEFIRLIAQSGAGEAPLEELADILETQGESENAQVVRNSICDFPEVREAASGSQSLTEAQLNTAHRRANERRRWEILNAPYGRC